MAKFLIILMAMGAALAYPAEDEVRPPSAVGTQDPVDAPIVPLSLPEQGPSPGAIPEQSPEQAEIKPEGTDLKTDNSYWYRRSYFPIVYARSYYRPRSYYSYYPYYDGYYW